MSFTEEDDGPYWLAEEESNERKYDVQGAKKTKKKRKKQLRDELQKKNRGHSVEELETEALEKGIQLEYGDNGIVKGWSGAPKGMLQVCYERGLIDPNKPPSYYKAAIPKAWKDNNGDVKPAHEEDVNTRVLPVILSQCEDFRNEISAMEHLCTQLDLDGCAVELLFSPKYHCELAGLGIELAWGYTKRYYRRYIPLMRKKTAFKACVDEALSKVTQGHCWRFCNRTRRYAMAYLHFQQDDVSFVDIERFVKLAKAHRCTMDQETGYIDDELRKAAVDEGLRNSQTSQP